MLLHQELYQLWLTFQTWNCSTELAELLVVIRVLVLLVKFFVFHQHDCDCEVQQEERIDNDAADEVENDEEAAGGVFVDVHDFGPAFHCNTLEDRDQRINNVIEISQTVI